jgi:putative ABC transport system substrate-binding protein
MEHRQSRREFVLGVGMTSLALLAGCGRLPWQSHQPAKVPRIGFVSLVGPGSDDEVLRQGLRELGWVEGQNIAIEWRLAEGREDRLPEFTEELVRLQVDVIVDAWGLAPEVTTTIPIVIPNATDPVSEGLVASLARPGGNVTGLSLTTPQLSGKRLELLKETVPGASRVAVLWNPANSGKILDWAETQRAAHVLGVVLHSLELQSPDDFEAAFLAATMEGADTVIIFADVMFAFNRRRIANLAARHRLPAIYPGRHYVAAGGLMSYGPNIVDVYRRAATYVDKILRGAKPGDLPVEQPTRFDLAINLKTAHALGLTIPRTILLQATEVIE